MPRITVFTYIMMTKNVYVKYNVETITSAIRKIYTFDFDTYSKEP